MGTSVLLTKFIAIRAVNIVMEALKTNLLDGQLCSREKLSYSIIVMNPTCRPGLSTFKDAILHCATVGDCSKYTPIAMEKARAAWENGMDTREIKLMYPYLFVSGNTIWSGSVNRGGLVVACSGLYEFADQFVCEVVASTITLLCSGQLQSIQKQGDKDFFD